MVSTNVLISCDSVPLFDIPMKQHVCNSAIETENTRVSNAAIMGIYDSSFYNEMKTEDR